MNIWLKFVIRMYFINNLHDILLWWLLMSESMIYIVSPNLTSLNFYEN